MIAYRKTDGQAHDIRFVAAGYQPIEGETLIEGNTLPSVEELSDPPTAEQLAAAAKEHLTDSVQRHLDAKAKERGYDNIFTASTYATSKHPQFGPEGIAFRDWRDAVWDYCYQVMADVQAGKREIPMEAALIAELPVLSLP